MTQAMGRMEDFLVHSQMNDGTAIVLRTIHPEDEESLREGIAKLSTESRYLRFFSPAPTVPDSVVEQLVDVDGVDHLAWGAICTGCDDPYPIGAVHAVRHKSGGSAAEYSIAVLDAFHGQGVARMLTAALLIDCHRAGISRLDVFILTENRAAAMLVQSMGAIAHEQDQGMTEWVLNVEEAIHCLRHDENAIGLAQVFAQMM